MRTFDVSRIVCNACRGAGACVDSGVFIRRGNKTRFDEQPAEDLSVVYNVLENGDSELVKLLCIDIGKWIDKTDTEDFKKLLKNMQKASDKFIFAFRVPFVDKDVLGRVATSLNDLMSVRVLSIPPFDNVQTKEIARRDLQNYGLEMSVAAWQCFFERIAEEKRDGKFYGLNTIKRLSKSLCTKASCFVERRKRRNDYRRQRRKKNMLLQRRQRRGNGTARQTCRL